jgi:hypothetical protein
MQVLGIVYARKDEPLLEGRMRIVWQIRKDEPGYARNVPYTRFAVKDVMIHYS